VLGRNEKGDYLCVYNQAEKDRIKENKGKKRKRGGESGMGKIRVEEL